MVVRDFIYVISAVQVLGRRDIHREKEDFLYFTNHATEFIVMSDVIYASNITNNKNGNDQFIILSWQTHVSKGKWVKKEVFLSGFT